MILSITTCILLSDSFSKKQLQFITSSPSVEEAKEYFEDLDGDGNYERITELKNVQGLSSYYIRWDYQTVFKQFDFNGDETSGSFLNFLDYDNNGYKEIYNFYHRNDSLFLSGLEFGDKPKFVLYDYYIGPHRFHKGASDVRILNSGIEHDSDGDGFSELYFTFVELFYAFPRALYALDIKRKELKKGPEAAILSTFHAKSTLTNGETVFLDHQSTPKNTEDYPVNSYNDSTTYFYLLSDHLRYEVNPVEIRTGRSTYYLYEHRIKGGRDYFIAFTRVNKNELIEVEFLVFNSSGEVITRESTVFNSYYGVTGYVDSPKGVLLFSNDGTILRMNNDFELEVIYSLKTKADYVHPMDLDGDGLKEVVFTEGFNKSVTILDGGLDFVQTFKVENLNRIRYVHTYKNDEYWEVVFDDEEYLYRYRYTDNPYYFAKYPAYLLVFSLFIYLGRLLENYRFYRKEASKKDLIAWQLKALKNQIDPHFTFNVLNSVSAAIHKGNKVDSIKYFNRFSSLLRQILEDSDDIVISLEKELEIVENYLALEKLRFKEKLDYDILVDDKLDRTALIPKLIILNQTENAIKHGLMHKPGVGKVVVNVTEREGYLHIRVKDNGIGREASKKYGTMGLGKGENLTQQSIELYEKAHHREIKFDIKDLKDGDESLGTLVNIKIKI